MKKNITSYQNSAIMTLLVLILLGIGISTCFAQGPWTQKEADMPTGRWELSTCVVDGKIYAIGGAGPVYQALGTVEVYDPATDSWDTTKTRMPTARQGLSTSVVNGKIYAIGGGAGSSPNYAGVETFRTVEEYDPVTDTWTPKTDMTTARGFHSANVLDDKIYVIGGSSSNPYSGTAILAVEVYDPATDTWTQKGNIPARIGAGFSSVVDGKIYAFGGYGSIRKTYEYDPVADTWTQKTDMPTSRCVFSTSVLDGKIYAIGGHPGIDPYQALVTVEEYDPATDTWTIAQDMLTGRCGVRTSVVNGKIYAIGGYMGTWLSEMCVTVEEYDPYLDLLLLFEKTVLDRGYVKPGIDSVLITTKMKVNTGIKLLAEIETPDQTPVDSLQLFDDGNHNDGNAGDSLYANVWPVLSAEEQYYYVDLQITRIDMDMVNYHKDNVATFTTIGPLKVDDYEITSPDTVPNHGDFLNYKLTLRNEGQTGTATDVTTHLIRLDTCATISGFTDKPYGDIAPGATALHSGSHAIIFSDTLSGCSNPMTTQILVEISSDGQVFWYDTLEIEFIWDDIEDVKLYLPKSFALNQNYPNPFNPRTIINYELPTTNDVNLSIYNLLGQKMATLVNEQKRAGFHQVEWDAGQLSSGVYYYRIEAGEFQDVKKMVLLR